MIVIGIAGGTGAGKTHAADALLKRFPSGTTVVIPHDAYYKDLSHLSEPERAHANFDHPGSLETALLIHHLDQLRSGLAVTRPAYDFTTHTRLTDGIVIEPVDVVIVEGILLLENTSLRSRFDLKLFVDTADDVRLSRRLSRDTSERGRTVDSVLRQWTDTAQPMHRRFVAPSARHADFILNGERDLTTAVGLLAGALHYRR